MHKNPVNQVTANRDTNLHVVTLPTLSGCTYAFCWYMQIQLASDQVPIGDSNFTYPGHKKFVYTLSVQPNSIHL